MGNPDSPTPPHIVAKLIEAVQDPRTHRYSMSKGIPGLRKALAGYYDRRFGVKLDPETEVVATLGSKEGLANLAQAITSPGRHHPGARTRPTRSTSSASSSPAPRVRSIPYTPDDEMLRGARPRRAAFRAEADGGDRELPLEPDGAAGAARVLQGAGRLLPPARAVHPLRPRLRRDLFRRPAAALRAAGAGRQGRDGRVHLACPRPTTCRAGAWASRPATRG